MISTPSGGPRTWDGSTPPVITSDEPGSWAHDTVSRRLREDILARVFRDNADVLASGTIAEANLRALDAELAAAATSVITRVPPDGGPDVDTWTQLCEPHLGKTWLEAPWLFAEFYFYRRILAAIGYFDPASPAFGHDPFARDKRAGLDAGMGAAASLARRANAFAEKCQSGSAATAEEVRLFLMVALWGNRMDLSIWPEDGGNEGGGGTKGERAANAFAEALSSGEKYLLADDSQAAARLLLSPAPVKPHERQTAGGTKSKAKDVSVVVDNAGFELTCDLALADALIVAGCTRRVTLRVKAHPVFVSDATVADAMDTIHAMASSADADVAAMGARWRVHLSSGAWVLVPDFAWCQPQPFWSLPEPVAAELRQSRLVIVKGDANYRRLLGDARWDLATPFEDVTCCFPAPLLALRTLKAELGCGIPRLKAKDAEEKRPGDWMTSGTFGCAQLNAAPAGQHAVASLATALPRDASFAGGGGREGGKGEGEGGFALTERERLDLTKTIVALANASRELARELRSAPARSSVALGSVAGGARNATGDDQRKLDVVADDIFASHLEACGGVRWYSSEETDFPLELDANGTMVVCCDPLDGSRNIDCNIPVGSIFGVYRVVRTLGGGEGDGVAQCTQPARSQLAAGYAHHSGATTLVLAVGDEGSAVEFVLDDDTGAFVVANDGAPLRCPPRGQIYSLNDARFDDWPEGLRRYVTDARRGENQTGKQYSARYVCSLVGDFHRTMKYGGWCGNPRPHLRRQFEVAPLAFVARAAGAAATDGSDEDLMATETGPITAHERTPLFVGSVDDVGELLTYGDIRQVAKAYAL